MEVGASNRQPLRRGTPGEAEPVASDSGESRELVSGGGIFKKCVNSQAVYPLSEQHGLKARERRYTAHEEGKHWE